MLDFLVQKGHSTPEVPDVLAGETAKTNRLCGIFLLISVASIHKKEVEHHGDRYRKVVQ